MTVPMDMMVDNLETLSKGQLWNFLRKGNLFKTKLKEGVRKHCDVQWGWPRRTREELYSILYVLIVEE